MFAHLLNDMSCGQGSKIYITVHSIPKVEPTYYGVIAPLIRPTAHGGTCHVYRVSIHQPLMTVARHYLVIPSSVLSLVDPTTGSCDVSPVPLYQWRQIRDHTLRIDDGRDGLPNMVLSFDSQRPSQIFVRR